MIFDPGVPEARWTFYLWELINPLNLPIFVWVRLMPSAVKNLHYYAYYPSLSLGMKIYSWAFYLILYPFIIHEPSFLWIWFPYLRMGHSKAKRGRGWCFVVIIVVIKMKTRNSNCKINPIRLRIRNESES